MAYLKVRQAQVTFSYNMNTYFFVNTNNTLILHIKAILQYNYFLENNTNVT